MKQPGALVWFVCFDEALSDLKQVADRTTITRPKGKDIHAVTGTGWLDGFKVLDLTNVIAGPHSGAFLGRFGAEVIKLASVKQLYDPLIGIQYNFQTDMGKKKALLDIQTD